MKKTLLLLFTFIVSSCAGIKVNYDYDKNTSFNNYTTYNYFPNMVTGLSDLDAKRLLDAVDANMAAKGILLAEEPDFLINIQSRSYQGQRNNALGVGLGGTGRRVGGGVSIGIPVGQPNVELELQFDFIDSQKNVLFWQGVSQSGYKDGLSPIAREQRLREIANKVFTKYPPKR
ncbi:DUF4136 domain-containing protein [Arenibacter sp. GZD96]|uniref:DUF4136 domain-containing protein n=1 Tax=Aurantibrevibacter litoralis TaxID=3106030 RepID=UPI002AFF6108|nr:DUF4136 domain-containing protein [Arenibacter sp. GZD-96]MEA1785915.1 DUF4136 domain-containing protein [Arenibacter sp. GZD-96]